MGRCIGTEPPIAVDQQELNMVMVLGRQSCGIKRPAVVNDIIDIDFWAIPLCA
jgi:hypothetical protein